MELKLYSDSKSVQGMKKCHELMNKYFDKEVELINYYGPVQMCVFGLEYRYIPEDLILKFDCERGCIVLYTINNRNEMFDPSMIFKEADYYHYD